MPDLLAKLVCRCLHEDPEKRFQSARHLVSELDDLWVAFESDPHWAGRNGPANGESLQRSNSGRGSGSALTQGVHWLSRSSLTKTLVMLAVLTVSWLGLPLASPIPFE